MVKKENPNIIWDEQASYHLKEIYDYIRVDSEQGAKKVTREILSTVKKLPENPYIFEKDKFKINNSGEYRAFTIYSYRIAYKVTEDLIQVLRIRHTGREPKEY